MARRRCTWAARTDNAEIARALLSVGAGVDVANRYGVTALSLAATNGSPAMVDLLLAAGANANATLPEGETVLMTAARSGNADVVRALLARGAVVDARESGFGETALMWAAAENHAGVVDALVAHGADPNLQSTPTSYKRRNSGQSALPRGGWTAAMYAARAGAGEAIAALAARGA